MSYTGYIVWFIAMAIVIAAILAFGTLHMAGVLPGGHAHQDDEHATAEESGGEQDHDTHHHWWHRAA